MFRNALRFFSVASLLLVCTAACDAAGIKFNDWKYNYTSDTEYRIRVVVMTGMQTDEVILQDSGSFTVYGYMGSYHNGMMTMYKWYCDDIFIPASGGSVVSAIAEARVNGGSWYYAGSVVYADNP